MNDDNIKWQQLVRKTDPNTSKVAAKEEVGRINNAKERILELIVDVGGISGMTDEELALQDGITTSKYRTARVFLERKGLLQAVGVRKSKHGKNQRVWYVTPSGALAHTYYKEKRNGYKTNR